MAFCYTNAYFIMQWKFSKDDHQQLREDQHEDEPQEDQCTDQQGSQFQDHQDAVWVPGSKDEDKQRYRELMKYMEEKRMEAKELLKEEKERKETAKKREESWKLLRLSIDFLRE